MTSLNKRNGCKQINECILIFLVREYNKSEESVIATAEMGEIKCSWKKNVADSENMEYGIWRESETAMKKHTKRGNENIMVSETFQLIAR